MTFISYMLEYVEQHSRLCTQVYALHASRCGNRVLRYTFTSKLLRVVHLRIGRHYLVIPSLQNTLQRSSTLTQSLKSSKFRSRHKVVRCSQVLGILNTKIRRKVAPVVRSCLTTSSQGVPAPQVSISTYNLRAHDNLVHSFRISLIVHAHRSLILRMSNPHFLT